MKAEYRVINEFGESCSGKSAIGTFEAAVAWANTVDQRHDRAVCGGHIIQTRLVEDWFDVEHAGSAHAKARALAAESALTESVTRETYDEAIELAHTYRTALERAESALTQAQAENERLMFPTPQRRTREG